MGMPWSADDGDGAETEGFPLIITRTIEVEIPVEVLTEKDCEARWRSLPQLSRMVGPCYQLEVPETAMKGCELRVPYVRDGMISPYVSLKLPDHISAGDTVAATRREDNSWRLVRKSDHIGFTLPQCEPDVTFTTALPDGSPMDFQMPRDLSPGDFVSLRRRKDQKGEWAIESATTAAALLKASCAEAKPEYEALLEVLIKVKCFDNIPLDENGDYRVHIPFCARFSEHRALGRCLEEQILSRGAKQVKIFATELSDRYYRDWAAASTWYKKNMPRISLQAKVADLAEDMPPRNIGLCIGVHPEVTKGGCWFAIVGALLQGMVEGGVCVFVTFYEVEMITVVNMIQMFGTDKQIRQVDVVNNPYYDSHPCPEHPPMRYIIIVRDDGVDANSAPNSPS
eukprot:TRINITY_DN32055_c0_g1_i1.p1 TRINITY_DN32055_c0_g1~~TRINITY_DN32055_c0_g1_i1.p1  ORF type:complete len:408 (+),score=83.48 TRINITY_DN32055_c0_g1_i1:35-1225(+)